MNPPTSRSIAVVGAGVFGVSVAFALVRAGCAVRLFDDVAAGPNASLVAAGMLAPFSEARFDLFAAPHLDLMIAARDLWTPLEAAAPGLRIDRSGVILAMSGERLAGDWRIADVGDALNALRGLFLAAGGVFEPRRFTLDKKAAFTAVILAPGAGSPALEALAPELAVLAPVKGQMARLEGGPAGGPVLRWEAGYLVPHPAGAMIGATMEPGVADLHIDLAVLEALRASAAVLAPAVAGLAFTGVAGVRMTSPDGLPLVGPSVTPGVFVAAGARRNGWLLAPLVAGVIAAYVTEADPGPWASALHPGRFAR